MATLSTILLVHGSWLGPWCWDEVIPLLESAGRRVINVQLTGYGEDQTSVADISLASYVDAVGSALADVEEPVILVGHSMAGAVISMAAEQWPDRIQTLVYLAAYLLESGQTIFQIAGADADSSISPLLEIDEAAGTISIKSDGFIEVFCPDALDEAARFARERLRPEPLAPLATPFETSLQRWGSIPRVYVRATLDRVISPATQDLMLNAIPCQKVHELPTSHSPFLSTPKQLADLLSAL